MARSGPMPYVEASGVLVLAASGQRIPVGSAAWYTWLEGASSFAFHGAAGAFTAHKERRAGQRTYWKAYRKRRGRMVRGYLGRSEELTLERLVEVAASFAASTVSAGAPAETDARPDTPVPARPSPAQTWAAEDPLGQVLVTKLLVPPPRAGLVARPQLVARLNSATRAGARLVLVSAPAGSGKTTAVLTWLQQMSETAVAWLSLDAGDNDLGLFLAALAAALDRARPGAGAEAAGVLRAHPAQPPAQTIITMLLNAVAHFGGRLALVLDDYHAITDPPIHALLAGALDRLPPGMQIVITSRADPPLPLARLRARGQLAELRTAELRFSVAEAVAFLRDLHQIALPSERVAALTARTEGWVTGLQLAALALTHHGPAEADEFLADFTGSHRYVFSYLADEVFAQQTPAVQEFLLRTSLLARLCGPLCAAVTGQPAAQAVLEELEANNLFVTPLDQQQRWYRYHPLFRDFLAERLVRAVGDAERRTLQRRASAWFANHGSPVEAVEHLLSAQDWEGALQRLAPLTASDQMYSYLLDWPRWLAALPDAALTAQPDVGLRLAWALINTGHAAAAVRPLALSEAAWRAGGDGANIARARSLKAAALAFQGDAAGAGAAALAALADLPPNDMEQRGYTTYFLGIATLMLGHVGAALPHLEAAQLVLQRSPEPLLAIGSRYGLARVYHRKGQLHHAATLYHTVIQPAGAPTHHLVPLAYHDLGSLVYEWNDLEGAEALLRDGIVLGERTGRGRYFPEFYGLLAQVLWARGENGAAQQAIATALDVARFTAQPVRFARAAALAARFCAEQGDAGGVHAWLGEQERAAAQSGQGNDDHTALMVARLRIDLERRQANTEAIPAIIDDLERRLGRASADERGPEQIAILSVIALAWSALDDHEQAMAALGKALDRAEPEGYIRTFIDEGAQMWTLLVAYQRRLDAASNGRAAYLERLIQAASLHRDGAARTSDASGPLSERERAVLDLLSEGCTAQEVATRLVISVHTARTHLKHIYAKLGARNRIEALERARSLGLLTRRSAG